MKNSAGGLQAAWQPSAATIRAARITAFTDWLAAERGLRFADYDALWRWSVDDLEAFWAAVWDYFQFRPQRRAAVSSVMRGCPAPNGFPASI
jgi:acetoacetyl-CoA synthetase